MDITTYYNNFSIMSFSEIDKTCVFSSKPTDRGNLFMKIPWLPTKGGPEYNCISLRTGEYGYFEDDDQVYVPRAELTINW